MGSDSIILLYSSSLPRTTNMAVHIGQCLSGQIATTTHQGYFAIHGHRKELVQTTFGCFFRLSYLPQNAPSCSLM